LYAQRVRIVAGRYEAEHPRKFLAQESSWLAEHRAAMVSAVSGKRGKRYWKRQQLLELACIMHEEWNCDRAVDRAKHDCDEWQNLT
jgi:hypothetical protein